MCGCVLLASVKLLRLCYCCCWVKTVQYASGRCILHMQVGYAVYVCDCQCIVCLDVVIASLCNRACCFSSICTFVFCWLILILLSTIYYQNLTVSNDSKDQKSAWFFVAQLSLCLYAIFLFDFWLFLCGSSVKFLHWYLCYCNHVSFCCSNHGDEWQMFVWYNCTAAVQLLLHSTSQLRLWCPHWKIIFTYKLFGSPVNRKRS